MTADQRIDQVLPRLTFGPRPGDFEADEKDRRKGVHRTATRPRRDRRFCAEETARKTPDPDAVKSDACRGLQSAEAKTDPDAGTEIRRHRSCAEPTRYAHRRHPTPKPTPTPKNPYQVVTELQRAKLLRAVYSERQLYEVMVDFWENHFSIYANKDADRLLLTGFDRDTIRPFAFGRFRDLLGATAHSPAMLFYLDNWQSSVVREYPATKDKPARKTAASTKITPAN